MERKGPVFMADVIPLNATALRTGPDVPKRHLPSSPWTRCKVAPNSRMPVARIPMSVIVGFPSLLISGLVLCAWSAEEGLPFYARV